MKANAKIRPGLYLSFIAAVLALAGIFLYNRVQYQNTFVPILLGISALLAIVVLYTVKAFGKKGFTNLMPVINAILTATALGMAVASMTNEIALVFSGLNPMDSLSPLLVFVVLTGIAWLLNLIASFTDIATDP